MNEQRKRKREEKPVKKKRCKELMRKRTVRERVRRVGQKEEE